MSPRWWQVRLDCRHEIGEHGGMASFDEKAADWDTPERTARARQIADAIRRRVPLQPSMQMVEVGAGTGLLGLDLLTDVGSVLLTDPSAGMTAVAREKIAAAGLSNAATLVYDVPADPPPGAPFDVAVSMLALHHIEDTAGALASICTMLRPGGWIALADLEAEDGTFHDADAEGIHHHGFDHALLTQEARSAGFTDVDVTVAGSIERNGRDYSILLLTGRRPGADEQEPGG